MKKFGPIGIDFGTTKTTLVYAEPDGGRRRPIVKFPTAVAFKDENHPSWDNAIVGQDAYDSPDGWKEFKLFMAEEYLPIERCRENPLEQGIEPPSAVHLASIIFRHLKEILLKEIGIDDLAEEVGPVTITVPSETTFRHRQAVIFAASVAGFREISILEEPVAAYLMHFGEKLSKTREKLRSLVIDYGGGTCDLAVIENEPGEIPIVLESNTKHIGGNQIDEAIIQYWKEERRFDSLLPEDNDTYPPELTKELKIAARFTKHACNPLLPAHTLDGINALLANPLTTQRSSDLPDDILIYLHGGVRVRPPKTFPEDFDIIMRDFIVELERQIKYLLPTENDIHSIKKVVFAGGSCYIRQILQFVMTTFSHLSPKDSLLFDEPEYAIAFGAFHYQKEKSEGRNPIYTRLPMSTYLQVDYDHNRDISPLRRWLVNTEFFYHNDKSYIELAPKGMRLKLEKPFLNPLLPGIPYKIIPLCLENRDSVWYVFQARSSTKDGNDVDAIDEKKPIDQIPVSLSLIEQAFPGIAVIRLMYAFDIYGDFYRSTRNISRLFSNTANQRDKFAELDWRDHKRISDARKKFFAD